MTRASIPVRLLLVLALLGASSLAAGSAGGVERAENSVTSIDHVSTIAGPDARPAPSTTDDVATDADASTASNASTGSIAELYPNPVASEDRGEYVVVDVSRPKPSPHTTRANWTLTDGEAAVALPPNATGRVVITPDPGSLSNASTAASARFENATVVVAPAGFALSNGGETVELRRDGTLVDAVTYENAPEGERRLPDATRRWRPVGLAPRPVRTAGPTTARTFVLPDDPGLPMRTLEAADERVLLAGYTFSSSRAADRLVAAVGRGVTVRVLVDDAPVGGISTREAHTLDRLAAAGVDVRVIGGERARYDFHHPKYAVVDDRALVMTENWKPAGVGGHSSRGWGARVDSAKTADQLAAVFRDDAGWRDSTPWAAFRRGRTFENGSAANESYPHRFDARTTDVERVRLVTAPGNAERAVTGVVDNATRRVDVVQPTIGSRHLPFLRACMRAADRGVTVRILLSNAWYVADENRELVDWLNAEADARDWPLTARVADPRGRYEKIHAKGVVADDAAVVGSLNWNNNSVRENREVAVVLVGDDAAEYYRGVFDADWRASGDPRLPVGVAIAGAVAALAAGGFAKSRIEFEGAVE